MLDRPYYGNLFQDPTKNSGIRHNKVSAAERPLSGLEAKMSFKNSKATSGKWLIVGLQV